MVRTDEKLNSENAIFHPFGWEEIEQEFLSDRFLTNFFWSWIVFECSLHDSGLFETEMKKRNFLQKSRHSKGNHYFPIFVASQSNPEPEARPIAAWNAKQIAFPWNESPIGPAHVFWNECQSPKLRTNKTFAYHLVAIGFLDLCRAGLRKATGKMGLVT